MFKRPYTATQTLSVFGIFQMDNRAWPGPNSFETSESF